MKLATRRSSRVLRYCFASVIVIWLVYMVVSNKRLDLIDSSRPASGGQIRRPVSQLSCRCQGDPADTAGFCVDSVGFFFICIVPVGASREARLHVRYVSWTIAAINALQLNGQWTGPVYVVTNDEEGFFGARFENPESVCVLPGSMADLFNNSGWNPRLRSVPERSVRLLRRNRIAYKLWKTQMLYLAPCDRFFYIDSDVVVSASMEEFVREQAETQPAIGLFEEQGMGGKLHGTVERFHTGIMTVGRTEISEEFLLAWEQELIVRTGKGTRDQTVLNRLIQDRGWEDNVKLFDSSYFSFPTPELIRSDEKLPLFVHITHYRRKKYGPDLCDRLRTRLGLPQSLEFD